MQRLQRFLGMLWASPYSLVGLSIGGAALCTGGRVRVVGHVLEFSGGAARWFLSRLPDGDSIAAMTLGHTILGQTEAALDLSRSHELVHVRQYERWGPFFGPAYVLCSLALWIRGKDRYRDNPFERQAFREG
jgi:hypothetical protein